MKFKVGLFGIQTFIQTMCPLNRKLIKTPNKHIYSGHQVLLSVLFVCMGKKNAPQKEKYTIFVEKFSLVTPTFVV